MRLGRLLVVVGVWGAALVQAGCVGCGDLPVTYGGAGTPAGGCVDGRSNADGTCDTGGDTCQGDSCAPAPTPPSCSDGRQNGTETGVDCGGVCPACSGEQACVSDADCPSPTSCLAGVCAQCTDSTQCSDGLECRAGGCVADGFAPQVRMAFVPGSTVLRVRFSEPMLRDDSAAGVLNPDNYCVEVADETPEVCTPSDGFWLGSVITEVDPSTVDIQLPFAPGGGRYTVFVSNVVDRASHALGSPRHADFEVGAPLQLLSATAQGPRRVLLTFSQPVPPGPDAAGSAGCTSPATCASRYQLSGATALGDVLSAEVLPAPRDNEVLLTHAASQRAGQYTVVVSGGLAPAVGGASLGAAPMDRAMFTGSGALLGGFQDGPVLVDAFADGAAFTSLAAYRERLYLGTNATGARAVGMDPDGFRPENLSFRFRKDTQKLSGSRGSNTAGWLFPSIGFAGCQANTFQCGPDNEDGRARFASGTLEGSEWLMMSGTRSNGGLGYVYLSRDDDATLDVKYVDLGQALDGTSARSVSAAGFLGGRAYLGIPTRGGVRRPELLALLRAPAADAQGLEARGNGANGGACKPSAHDLCNLSAYRMPGIGASGSPANKAPVVGIDFVAELNGRLYLGNNGGLVRATVEQPLDYESSPEHWVSITPSAPEYRARESLTTDKLVDLEPADRAWSRMVVFEGHVYLGRNTTAGPQLWRCEPERVSAPAPATAEDCDAGDWVLVAANGQGDGELSQFDNPNNTRLTLLAVNGGHLYVGFDNAVDGVTLYRSVAGAPASRSDFTAQGLGPAPLQTRFGEAATVGAAGQSFLYVPVSGGPGTPVRLYRQRD